jgi:hypothetical protein
MSKAFILTKVAYSSFDKVYLEVEDIKSVDNLKKHKNEDAFTVVRTGRKSYDSKDTDINLLSAMNISSDLALKENRVVVIDVETLKEVPLFTGKEI